MDIGIIGDHTAEEAGRREVREVGPCGADRECGPVETTLVDHVVLGNVNAVEELPM